MTRYLIFFVVLFQACQTPPATNGGWQKVFANDADGNSIFGEKTKLLDAVRLGYPIRIGWGSNRVEHVADAAFLTIFQGEEVFAQIETIVGQAPAIEHDSLKLRFRMDDQWTKIAGTNGYSTAFMKNLKEDHSRGGEDRYSATTWYVLYPTHRAAIDPRPLWREGSPNWEQWDSAQNMVRPEPQ